MKVKTRAKTKARDLVWDWPRGKSHTVPDVLAEIKRTEFHLVFAETMGDEDEMLRLGLWLNEEAVYRIGQHQLDEIYRHNRVADPDGSKAMAHFSQMAEKFALGRLVNNYVREQAALRRGMGIGTNPYLN